MGDILTVIIPIILVIGLSIIGCFIDSQFWKKYVRDLNKQSLAEGYRIDLTPELFKEVLNEISHILAPDKTDYYLRVRKDINGITIVSINSSFYIFRMKVGVIRPVYIYSALYENRERPSSNFKLDQFGKGELSKLRKEVMRLLDASN